MDSSYNLIITEDISFPTVNQCVIKFPDSNSGQVILSSISASSAASSRLTINNNELKANVIDSINKFFSIEYWNFGDTFYFQELSAYVMNNLSPELVSIVIVPKQASQTFGSLFEIKSESDEIFINAAQVSDVEIIDEITASNLQASDRPILAYIHKAVLELGERISVIEQKIG